MRMAILLVAACIAVPLFAQSEDVLSLGDFETWTWQGTVKSDEQVKQGQYSGKWADLSKEPSIRPARVPEDWSGYDRLMFWLYSEKANGQQLTLVCNSEDQKKEGWDYYFLHFRVDWQGWKHFNLRLGTDITPTRFPLGWQQIDYLSINAGGWQHSPLKDTVLYIDDVKLVRDPLRVQVTDRSANEGAAGDGRSRIVYTVEVTNQSETARSFKLSADASGARAYRITQIPPRTPSIAPGESATVTIELEARQEDLKQAEPLTREEFVVKVEAGVEGAPEPEVLLGAAVPLPKREHPLLFATAETIEKAKQRAGEYPWAKSRLESIINTADSTSKMKVEIPDEAGQWGHHYVCNKCGAGLRNQDGKHICKECGAEYTGWPYDQVVIAGVHHRHWNAVRDLGLGYAFTGNEDYAKKAREILLGYADKYLTYPIHNVRDQVSNSGARVFAQTLDESVSIIGVAWGYDLMYNSPSFSAEDKEKIEGQFLRQVVETVKRNNAGISNWQSWHNAGMAAVGFCLQDEDIASYAINGRSGLRFQLNNSILPDGFWYEGTAAYHYYALDALRWTVEAAHFAGIDFYANEAYKSLYDAPLLYTFPDLQFPAVNDSDVFSISGRHAMYELAYARFGDPSLLAIAAPGNRNSLEAFLWGAEELPPAPVAALASRDFEGLGAAVLRQGDGEDQMYLHLDYGPHGGGHGHQDKLALILFALGKQLAPDPGRLAYGAPLQGSWYKQTFAHNTVCVDQRSQQATEGKLKLFYSKPGLAIAQAECDTAYPGVMMKRTSALTGRYLIDVFEVSSEQEHTYDWLWHNFGELKPGLPVSARGEPLETNAGYQHLEDISQATTGDTWFADFKQEGANVRVTMAGVPGTSLYFGMGMANNPPRPCPMMVSRREGKSATFISVIEPYRDEPLVTGVTVLEVPGGHALELQISRGEERDLFMIADTGGTRREFGGVATTARACFVRMEGDTPAEVHHVE